MISILNSVFHCVILNEMNKTKYHLHIFKDFLNQLNLLYIWTYLYLQQINIYEHAS
jgi:hypothetical protein